MFLPVDLLNEIFLLVAAGHALEPKFLLTQVCARWRSAALDLPLLWTRMNIASFDDIARLPTVLQRSASAVLDIEVTHMPGSGRGHVDVAHAILANRHRVQRLQINYDWSVPGRLAHLLSSGMLFPVLLELELRSPSIGYKPFRVFVVPPVLRRLVLVQQDHIVWSTLLTSSLLELTVINYQYEYELPYSILQNCPQLEYLKLDMGHGFAGLTGMSAELWHGVPRLRKIVLGMDYRDMAAFFSDGFSGAEVLDVTAHVRTSRIDQRIKRVIEALLHYIESPRELSVLSGGGCRLRDSAGRVVWLDVAQLRRQEWSGVWMAMCRLGAVQHSISILRIPFTIWLLFNDALIVRPLLTQNVVVHVDLDGINFQCHSHCHEIGYSTRPSSVRRPMCFPGLRRVVFHDKVNDGAGTTGKHLTSMLIALHDIRVVLCPFDHIDHPIEVCMSDVTVLRSDAGVAGLISLCTELSAKNSVLWRLCQHCAVGGFVV